MYSGMSAENRNSLIRRDLLLGYSTINNDVTIQHVTPPIVTMEVTLGIAFSVGRADGYVMRK
jgi:hypothetical protein